MSNRQELVELGRDLGAALIVVGILLVLASLSLPWAANLGDNRTHVCVLRTAPVEVAQSGDFYAWTANTSQSWWPLGVVCTWTNRATGESVSDRPNTGYTITGIAGLLSVTGGASLVFGFPCKRSVR